jgi:hypothetical protein
MKTSFFIIFMRVFILFGCTSKHSAQLTQQQKEKIKKEIKASYDSIIAKAQRLDEGFLQYFYSPELVVVGSSSLEDYQAFKRRCTDDINSAVTLTWTEVRWECIVLYQDLAISSWTGKFEALYKSGSRITIDPLLYTDVFKNVNGQWKVIYEQGFSIPEKQKVDQK